MPLANFIQSLTDIRWFVAAGSPIESAVVAADAASGYDAFDSTNSELWREQTLLLETLALESIGDEAISESFERVSSALNAKVRAGLEAYFARRPDVNANTNSGADYGLWPEILEASLRDVSWAAVEFRMGRGGFFSEVLEYYRAGRWPCGWVGKYPEGRPVVL